MNFNKDLIHNLEGQNISKTIKETKNVVGRIVDEFAPGTSKDISQGVAAEESLGRAAFSMANKTPQFKLQERFIKICDELSFNDSNRFGGSYAERLKESCTTNSELNEELLFATEEFVKLSKAKPKEQQFCWETYFPYIINELKTPDGKINKEVYDSMKTLFEDPQISTRGIENIIKGCTEFLYNEKGEFVESFNKQAFDKYRSFMDINGKTMFEQDDVFTLYLGRTLDGCTHKSSWLRKGQEHIVDDVAFNFAKRLYQNSQDILHMDNYLRSYASYVKEGEREVSKGFEFVPKEHSSCAKKIIEDLKESIHNEELIECCKVDGQDSLHNLLVADTLKQETGMYYWNVKYLINALRDEKGLVPTDKVSYICKKGDKASICDADIQKCLRPNGTVDGYIWRKVSDGKINAESVNEYCRVNGDINYDNVEVLEQIQKRIKENNKYSSYHIRDTFEQLKNKDGVVDKNLLAPLDELIELTHLAPQELKDCLNVKGEVDRTLFELKKQVIKKNGTFATKIPEICKNSDGTANSQGIEAYRMMMESGLNNDQKVINTFTSEKGCDLEALKEFSREFVSTDKRYRYKILDMSIVGEYASGKEVRSIDLNKFRALKEAMSNPEIAPLMANHACANVVKSKFEHVRIKPNQQINYDWLLYDFSHLNPKSIEILEKNGYSAKFCNELGKAQKYFVETSADAVKGFEKSFVSGIELEDKLAKTSLKGNVSLEYTAEQLSSDIKKVMENLPEDDKATLTRVFRLEFGEKGIEGFPQRFDMNINPPAGMEDAFSSINNAINKFYSTGVKSDSAELKELSDELVKGFPEFKMLIGKTTKNGERVDLKTLEQLKTLITSPEYQSLTGEDKSVAKMTVLLNNLEHINSKPSVVKKQYMSDNDGLAVYIDANWKKQAEYASSILDRYNLSEQAKYRTTQLINDIGWSKELSEGALTPFDIAVNQRYKGDDIVSPLVEKVITGDCKFDKSAVEKEVKNIRKNQQIFLSPTMAELEPYIQTTKIDGQELRYVDLDRPELQDNAFLTHFLGYDGFDHTLNILRNRAYRTAFSASVVKGGEHSSCFAGRNVGIVFQPDNVNIAYVYHTNIDSGFGKQYKHLKEALQTNGSKDIKSAMCEELRLSDDEYAKLMQQTVHSTSETLPDAIINGRRITKEEIKKAHDKGVENILSSKTQNETTVLNPRPFAIMGIGDSINSYEVSKAVNMAQANDMLLLFKRRY